jgi:hypothetical protein
MAIAGAATAGVALGLGRFSALVTPEPAAAASA